MPNHDGYRLQQDSGAKPQHYFDRQAIAQQTLLSGL